MDEFKINMESTNLSLEKYRVEDLKNILREANVSGRSRAVKKQDIIALIVKNLSKKEIKKELSGLRPINQNSPRKTKYSPRMSTSPSKKRVSLSSELKNYYAKDLKKVAADLGIESDGLNKDALIRKLSRSKKSKVILEQIRTYPVLKTSPARKKRNTVKNVCEKSLPLPKYDTKPSQGEEGMYKKRFEVNFGEMTYTSLDSGSKRKVLNDVFQISKSGYWKEKYIIVEKFITLNLLDLDIIKEVFDLGKCFDRKIANTMMEKIVLYLQEGQYNNKNMEEMLMLEELFRFLFKYTTLGPNTIYNFGDYTGNQSILSLMTRIYYKENADQAIAFAILLDFGADAGLRDEDGRLFLEYDLLHPDSIEYINRRDLNFGIRKDLPLVGWIDAGFYSDKIEGMMRFIDQTSKLSKYILYENAYDEAKDNIPIIQGNLNALQTKNPTNLGGNRLERKISFENVNPKIKKFLQLKIGKGPLNPSLYGEIRLPIATGVSTATSKNLSYEGNSFWNYVKDFPNPYILVLPFRKITLTTKDDIQTNLRGSDEVDWVFEHQKSIVLEAVEGEVLTVKDIAEILPWLRSQKFNGFLTTVKTINISDGELEIDLTFEYLS